MANTRLSKISFCTGFLMSFTVLAQASEPIDQVLGFNPAYTTDLARNANQIMVEAATLVRQGLEGEPVRIPGDWRLVNVIAKSKDYVMFFQGGDGSVRSLRMQPDGSVSGHDTIWLQAR